MTSHKDGSYSAQLKSFATQSRVAVFSTAQSLPAQLERAATMSYRALVHHPLALLLENGRAPIVDCAWVILTEDVGYDALETIRRHVDTESIPLILQVSDDAIDSAWAMFGEHYGTIITIDPDEGACAIALAQAQRVNEPHFAAAVDDQRMRQIERLQEEVQRISKMLSHMAMSDSEATLYAPVRSREPASPFIEDHVRSVSRSFESQPPHATVSPRDVRRIIRARRMRDELFPADMFADPAWDMLLDLYAAKLDHARVSVSSLCIAAAVPATTALRWIKTLCETGIFLREADQQDGRRIFVALSDQATDAMHRYFAKRAEL